MNIGLTPFLIVAAVLFAIGVAVITTKRDAIGIWMGIELILNAANLNLVAFNHLGTGAARPAGDIFVLFVIVLSAAQAAVALAIFLNFHNNFAGLDVDRGDVSPP